MDPSIFKLLVGVRILPRSACNYCTQCPEPVTVQIHSLPTQLCWSLFKFTHCPRTPTETLLSPVAGAVALGAVPRQVAHATAVVALAVIHTAVGVRAVARQVASLSTAEARTRADLRAIALNVASHVAVVASS